MGDIMPLYNLFNLDAKIDLLWLLFTQIFAPGRNRTHDLRRSSQTEHQDVSHTNLYIIYKRKYIVS